MVLLKRAAQILVLLSLVTSTQVSSEELRIETPHGALLGEIIGKREDIAAFKGIPYAAPPVGHRRWKPPQAAGQWSGTRVAKTYAPECIQQLRPVSLTMAGVHNYSHQSEDCLYLNVFAPVASINGEHRHNLPVLFYIHGGGRVRGSAKGMEMASNLTREGIIVVTMNYRLGIFSFFAHPELSAESPHGASGNYGTLDLIQALKWVRENIGAFGGDPKNITIAGMSGGGGATGTLLATTLAKGLFHRAAPMCSGAGIRRMHLLKQPYLGEPSAEELGARFAKGIGAPTLAKLRDLPAQQIQEFIHAQSDTAFDSPTGLEFQFKVHHF